MERRHSLTRALLITSFALALTPGCPASHGTEPDGGGVCCPIADFSGCSPGATPLAAGGWAPTTSACMATISGFDGRPFARLDDEHGCPALREVAGCCGCVPDSGSGDGGTPPADASDPRDAAPVPDAPGACDGLAPAACLGASCAPVFDDACCRTCSPGGPCADCTNLEYHSCRPAVGPSCVASGECGTAPIWACGPAAPNCATANVVDVDSCDVTGCVPAYPSATGAPDVSMATCAPILAESCTVMCRAIAPPCPTGTTAEGDGFCYTDRCIPSFVCGR